MNALPGVKGFIVEPWPDRFWSKVDRGPHPGGCWLWLGPKAQRYGVVWFQGRSQRAHRIAWSIANGVPFPADKDACHRCDNPPCVNPEHIWPGTKSENTLDAVRKGRVIPPALNRKTPLVLPTHCAKGHLYDEKNTKIRSNGERRCRACQYRMKNASRQRKRALAVALLSAAAAAKETTK